ncbi:hypothetical protein ACETU7_08015 [Rhodococcus sp. 3Y1]
MESPDHPTSEHPERSAALAAQVDGLTDEEIVEWINREPDPSRTFLPAPAASTYQFAGFEALLDDNGAFVIVAPDLGLLSGEQTRGIRRRPDARRDRLRG